MPIGTALFAATTAFQLVKEGCALYKEVKGVAGNVKQIYDDLNDQFAGKKVSKAQAAEITKEKKRVEQVANANPDDVIFKIGEELGNMFDAFDRLEALFWEQEKEAKKLQAKDVSLKRMALKRILVRSKLLAMQVELREVMVYQSPPELGSLWSQFEDMRKQIESEQQLAREIEHRQIVADQRQRAAVMREVQSRAVVVALSLTGLIFFGWFMWQLKNQTAERAFFWHN